LLLLQNLEKAPTSGEEALSTGNPAKEGEYEEVSESSQDSNSHVMKYSNRDKYLRMYGQGVAGKLKGV
jgi:hypothetical protein